jgi:hypothetical protein
MPPLLKLGGRADTDAPGGYAAVWQVAELPPEVQARLRPNWLPDELHGEASRAEAARVVVKVLSPLNADTRLRTSDPDTARRGIQSDANSLADEARFLSTLQETRAVTPLLGQGFIEGPLGDHQPVTGKLVEDVDAFAWHVSNCADDVPARYPFLLLGNVPFAWSLLRLFLAGPHDVAPWVPFTETVGITRALLGIMRAAAQKGIVHDDLKLEHVAWRDGKVVLIDWNVGKRHANASLLLASDLLKLFNRVLFPLFTGLTVDGRQPATVFGTSTPQAIENVAFPPQGRLRDRELQAWLARGVAEQYASHDDALRDFERWWQDTTASVPEWTQLLGLVKEGRATRDALDRRAAEARQILRASARTVRAGQPRPQLLQLVEELSEMAGRMNQALSFMPHDTGASGDGL